MGEETKGAYDDREGTSDGTQKFYNFLNDADRPLYERCTEFTKFSVIVDFSNLECMAGWTNNSFTWLLEMLNKMLSLDALLPKNTYEVKKYMREFVNETKGM
jgi:hypothetical protein